MLVSDLINSMVQMATSGLRSGGLRVILRVALVCRFFSSISSRMATDRFRQSVSGLIMAPAKCDDHDVYTS